MEADASESSITLVGTSLAHEGKEFVYEGPAEACEDCGHRDNCLNLDEGVRYVVDGVRDGGQVLDCAVHEHGGVRAVEVSPAPVVANVESKTAFEGSTVTVPEDACDRVECPAYGHCVPEGFDFGEPYFIEEILGPNPVDCHYDRSLELVELQREG